MQITIEMPSITLRDIPEKLNKFILKKQWEYKVKKGIGSYSQEQTVMQLLKEHKDFKKANKEDQP